jgi:replication initiation protein RepC
VLQANTIINKLKGIALEHQPVLSTQASDTVTAANTPMPEQSPEAKPTEPTATDGQNVRHKETQKSYTKKTTQEDIPPLWTSLSMIPSFHPDCPKSEHALLQLLFEFGMMLRISSTLLGKAVANLGLSKTVQLADQIAARVDQVQSPESYLAHIVARAGRDKVGHGQLLLLQ